MNVAFKFKFILFVAGQKQEQEPEFLAPLENHTVTQGRDVYFTCVVNHLSSYKVIGSYHQITPCYRNVKKYK